MKKYLSTIPITLIVIVGLVLGNTAFAIPTSYSEGPNNTGVGINLTGIGNTAWTNPGRIVSDNSSYAGVTLSNSTKISNYLKGTGYSFDIPSSATINGIQVKVDRYASDYSNITRIQDNDVRLLKDGSVVGDNKAVLGTNWPANNSAVRTYGGQSELWGTTWTPEDINKSDFGVALSVLNSTTIGWSYTAYVDYIQITVYYSDVTAPELTTPSEITFEATGPTTPASLIGATATDDIDPNPVVSYDPTDLSVGVTSVTVTANDSSGNSTSTLTEVTVLDTTAPTLTINGSNPLELWINEDYVEYGTTAMDLVDRDISTNVIVTENTVDNAVLGTYHVTYTISDTQGNSTEDTRVVYVIDRDRPIIHRIGGSPLTVEGGTTYEDPGATAIDQNGDDLTPNIVTGGLPVDTFVLGTTTITYDVMGYASTSATQAKRTVLVVDTTPPLITLNGINPVNMRNVDQYEELGANANDIIDGDLGLILPPETFDFGVPGTYTFTYTATDNSGNSTTTTRDVVVRNIGTDASLSDLSVSLGVLNPVFSSGTLDYTVELPYGTTETPVVSATATDPFAWSIGIVPAPDVTSATTSDRTTTITVTAEDQVTTLSYNIVFSVAAEPIPEIMNETVADKTTSSVTVSWLTDHPATSRVIYDTVSHTTLGAAPNYGYANSTTEDSTLVTNHSVTVTSLNPGTTYYIRTVSHGSPEVVSDEVVAKTDSRSSGGSSGGSSGSHSVTTTTDNSAVETVNFLHFLNLLSAIGNNNQTETSAKLAILPPALTAKATVIPEEIIATTTANEENLTPAPVEENNIPLSAAAATAGGLSINWWWVLLMIVVVGGLIYFYMRGRKDI